MISRQFTTKLLQFYSGPLYYCSFQAIKQGASAHRVHEFNCLKQLLSTLNNRRPAMHCILFTSAWNPVSKQAEIDFEQLSNSNMGYEFYKVDLDKTSKAKRYFGVKCEPQAFIYLQGAYMTTQIGANLKALQDKLNTVSDYSMKVETLEGTNVWEDPQAFWRRDWEGSHQPFDFFTRGG